MMRPCWYPLLLCAAGFGQTAGSDTDTITSLYRSKEWAEAARLAEALPSRSADMDLMLGLSLAHLDKLDQAANVFTNARRAHPRDPRFPLELAGVAYKRNNPAEAKRLLMQALRMAPANEYGNSFLGSLFLLDGNLPATLKYWNRVNQPLLKDVYLRPTPTLDPLLRDRALWVSGGQMLRLDRLEMTTANLDRLAVFSNYRFDLTPAGAGRYDLTLFSMGQGLSNSRWPAMLPFARGLPYQTVFLDWNNLGRRAIHVDSLIRWDRQKQRIAANIAAPLHLSPRWFYHAGFDARREEWDLTRAYTPQSGTLDGLRLRKVSLEAGIRHALSASLQWGAGLKSAYRTYGEADSSPSFRNGTSVEFWNSLDGRLWSRPENRVRVDGSLLLRTGRLFSNPPSPYTGVSGGSRIVWLPQAKGDDLVVSAHARAGKLFGVPPFDELFMLGMERDNDLWMRGHAGTIRGRKGASPMGRQYALVQLEFDRTVLRFPLGRLQLGPFVDTGRIGDPSGGFGSKGWMVDTGVQARVRVLGAFHWTFVYGRDLRQGTGVFYTALAR